MRTVNSLENIWDGNFYDIDDNVKADAKGCKGCSACCHDVGDLVVLSPYDMYRVMSEEKLEYHSLEKNHIEWTTSNKVTLPYLKMVGEAKRCSFLDANSRCTIHSNRPNICRLFPLGRVYENKTFKYFLQVNSCTKKELSEVKVSDWIDVRNHDENKEFLIIWHDFIKALTFKMKFVYDKAECDRLNKLVKDTFYKDIFTNEEEFYKDFFEKLPRAKNEIGII